MIWIILILLEYLAMTKKTAIISLISILIIICFIVSISYSKKGTESNVYSYQVWCQVDSMIDANTMECVVIKDSSTYRLAEGEKILIQSKYPFIYSKFGNPGNEKDINKSDYILILYQGIKTVGKTKSISLQNGNLYWLDDKQKNRMGYD